MRIRATVAAVSGALALSAVAVPAAQAGDSPSYSKADVQKAVQAVQSASGKSAFAAAAEGEPYALDLSFSGVKINNGKPIVAGIANQVTVPVTYTVTHAADIDLDASDFLMDVEIYRGASYAEVDKTLFGDDWPTCTATSSTTATCKGTIDVYPDFELVNADAGTWKAGGYAIDLNGEDPTSEDVDWSKVGYAEQDGLGSTKLQRYSKLTVNASPEPVTKGKTITVTGKLSRANWETHKYAGYATQSVKLQFRKKTSSTYTTVKTIKSNSTGNLSTTVTASADGYFRYSFAGTTTTPAVNAAGDFVDVR
ncbi:hypothetical protein [Streptomyces resistomycificus]|uniref:Lipoprotein n=1 Tax=Streptomyces resistomycificus TaxID=67356 RepID=A0A0L8L7E5_9ACTN|nr:hypothetical protein [Streptomyces resistomycificus]KOG34001.1 lipoprotein [Streptomyces resistomycificus]KUN96506.1 hypothetical protein AQJ84_19205 [Streptomyces resistomycificus]